jgi:hypothetical protein
LYDRVTKDKLETELNYFEAIYARIKDLAVSNIGEAIQLSKELIKGDIFLKVCKSTRKFVQRRIWLSNDESKICWVGDPPVEGETPRFI